MIGDRGLGLWWLVLRRLGLCWLGFWVPGVVLGFRGGLFFVRGLGLGVLILGILDRRLGRGGRTRVLG